MEEKEIRTRLRADDVERIALTLTDLGFQFFGCTLQTDVTYDRPDGSLFNSGYKIRVRRENDTMQLTYKGSILGRSDVSVRTEETVHISPDQFKKLGALLEAIGYPELFRVVKQRRIWKQEPIVVTIDDWPIIGPMIEIEGPDPDQLKSLSERLGGSYEFRNYRLSEFFSEVEVETGKSLAELQKEYEAEHGVLLGRLDLLIK